MDILPAEHSLLLGFQLATLLGEFLQELVRGELLVAYRAPEYLA